MHMWLCGCRIVLHLWLVSIAVLLLALLRSAVPTLSGIDQVFPLSVSKQLNAEEFNIWRTERANAVIDRLSNPFVNSLQNETNNTVNIVIIASGRVGYFLTQVVAGFLELLPNTSLNASISMCDVSITNDKEINRLSQIVPTIKLNSTYAYDYGKYETRMLKESNDYWSCMNITHNSRYVLLIEDDAVPVPAFGALLYSVIRRMDSDEKLDFIKLYHPGHLRKLPYYFQVSLTCLPISLLLTFGVWRSVVWLPLLLTFVFFVHHFNAHYTYQLFADLRYALTGSTYVSISESCCTPAVIYRSSSIPKMLDYLISHTHRNGLAKDDLLDQSPFVSRLTDTNLVIHIGYISALRGKIVTLDALKQLRKQLENVFPF